VNAICIKALFLLSSDAGSRKSTKDACLLLKSSLELADALPLDNAQWAGVSGSADEESSSTASPQMMKHVPKGYH
jgi:hypothetical protein